MEKMILRQLGNVMKFGDFCKSVNERMEVSISANDVLITPDQAAVLTAVGNKIEQICGWDMDILLKHIAEEYQISQASHEDLVIWIEQEVQKYFRPEVILAGGETIKGKEAEFLIAMQQLDYGMCVEKIVRRLRGLEEEDKKYPPLYLKRMEDLVREILDEKEDE